MKKFFRADHFRQHLKHSHQGTSGKWTNVLENACVKDEPPEKRVSPVVASVPSGQAPPALKITTTVSGPGPPAPATETIEEAEISEGELVDIADEAKIIEGSTKLAVGGEKVTSVEGEEASEKAKKKAEIKAPTVDIPEQLRSNPLMRILHKQALALWKDMDNTKDEEAGVKKGTKEDDDADADSEAQWRMLHRTFDDDDDDCDDC
jgi:hypothetical protein